MSTLNSVMKINCHRTTRLRLRPRRNCPHCGFNLYFLNNSSKMPTRTFGMTYPSNHMIRLATRDGISGK